MKKTRKNRLLLWGSQRIFATRRLSGYLSLTLVLMAWPSFGAVNNKGSEFREPGVGRSVASQQSKVAVKGKVTAPDGSPMPGVTVSVKGTTIGVVTDAEGNYMIEVLRSVRSLQFSFVGMKTLQVNINGRSVINVSLEDENRGLEEVVVVAYGTQKKVAVTGAVNSVSSKELMQSSSASLSNALAGRLAGLTSLENGGGQPGMDEATLYLRGAATINNSSPLILIDGVPRDNIRTLDANEVASVSILKDASATAVFGVRGANGVLLIITKRGVEGKAQLNLNVEQSFTSFTREPSRLHSVDYLKLRNEAYLNDGNAVPYSDAVIAKYQNPLAGLDPSDPDYASKARIREYMYPDHDYYNEYIRKYTPQTRVNMNISGGTKQVAYFVNAGFLHQGGNLNTESKSQLGYNPAAKMDRFSFRSNLDFKITKSLSAFLNLGTYIEQVNMPAVGGMYSGYSHMMSDLIYQAQTILPITPGPTTISGFGYNPGQIVDPGYLDRSAFEVMNRRGYRKDVRSNLNSSLGLTWDLSQAITPGLNVKGMISYDSYAGTTLDALKTERLYLANINYNTDQLSYSVKRDSEDPLSIGKSASTNYTINMQGSINYSQKFGKHEVGGMILTQRDYWEVESGSSDILIPYNVLGVCGRATYAYDNRYLGEIDMGYNGSEQFNPDKRYGFFPAASVGWVLTNESFLKNNLILTNLKLRASYGKVGNDKMGKKRFLYLDDTRITDGPLGSLGNGNEVFEGNRASYNLTWESSWKRNGGIDFQLFKDLSGSFDYFIEHRSDILITRHTVPTFQGVYLSYVPAQNMGIVYNHGYEVELTYNKALTEDFNFMIKGNYSYNKNIVKAADQVKRDASYAVAYPSEGSDPTYTTGYSLNQCFGYKIDWKDHGGYWISEDQIKKSGLTYDFGTPRVGDFKYVDVNGDGVINDKDMVPIGYSSIPRINYGVTLAMNYKDFDFTIFFQGVGEYSSNYSNQGVYENTKQGTYFEYTRTAWTLERYLKGEKITYPALSVNQTTNHTANDFFIMNRAFTRLKNIELGYTLPKNALHALGISKLRLSVGGQNLYTWDHLRMNHLDPENDNSIGYPSTKMVNFGLNMTF